MKKKDIFACVCAMSHTASAINVSIVRTIRLARQIGIPMHRVGPVILMFKTDIEKVRRAARTEYMKRTKKRAARTNPSARVR